MTAGLVEAEQCRRKPSVPAAGVLAYRPDVDGLRALAVLLVIAFHAFPRWLPGGFVGGADLVAFDRMHLTVAGSIHLARAIAVCLFAQVGGRVGAPRAADQQVCFEPPPQPVKAQKGPDADAR